MKGDDDGTITALFVGAGVLALALPFTPAAALVRDNALPLRIAVYAFGGFVLHMLVIMILGTFLQLILRSKFNAWVPATGWFGLLHGSMSGTTSVTVESTGSSSGDSPPSPSGFVAGGGQFGGAGVSGDWSAADSASSSSSGSSSSDSSSDPPPGTPSS